MSESLKTRIIAVAGGSGSGKTTLAKKIREALGSDKCQILGQDSYYFDQSHRFDGDGGSVNFDHPSALDFKLLGQHLQDMKSGRSIEIPIYDFSTHRRRANTETLATHPFVLVDGTLVLSQPLLLPIFDESIFLEVDEETRFYRRLKRDTEERGRTPEGVRQQFFRQVKVMHDEYVEPSKLKASFLLREKTVMVQKPRDTELHRLILEIITKL